MFYICQVHICIPVFNACYDYEVKKPSLYAGEWGAFQLQAYNHLAAVKPAP